jgi:RNA binding exosome subunit
LASSIVFKDLHKLVSQQQKENTRTELFERLKDKRFWIWDKQQHKLEDIRTDGDCCMNHIIGLPQKDGIDKPMYD